MAPANSKIMGTLRYSYTRIIIFSVASSSAADENRMEEARNYGRAAMWTSIVGAILSVITIIVVIVIVVNNNKETTTYYYG